VFSEAESLFGQMALRKLLGDDIEFFLEVLRSADVY